ncbi:MAG: DNA-3-methyladenine glycosylase 2 family protein [Chloroflexota bacterium]
MMTVQSNLHIHTGIITPTTPFDLAQSLRYLGMFTPTLHQHHIDEQSLTKALTIDGQTLAFTVKSLGSVDKPELAYTLYADRPIDTQLAESARDNIIFFLSLNEDLKAFYAIADEDPYFAPIVRKLYGLHQVKYSVSAFENACWAVLSQRNPMMVARKTKQKITERYGSSLEIDGEMYWAFPEPAQIVAADEEELAALVRNSRKVDCLRDVASAFSKVDETWLRTAPYDEVKAWLLSIKGIGEWSATFILLRGLGHMEHVSFLEKRLIEAIGKVYRSSDNVDELQRFAAAYGEWQGYWAYYLRANN